MKPQIQRRHHLNERLETATLAEGGQYAKVTSIASNAKLHFFMDSLIAHMIIKAIGCLTDVIGVLC